jgi:alkylated DNA repair dioxygenase AlkB
MADPIASLSDAQLESYDGSTSLFHLRHQPREWLFSEGDQKAYLRYWAPCVSPAFYEQIVNEVKGCRLLETEKVGERKLRRSSVGFGRTGYRYKYNGGDRPANPMPDWLKHLTTVLEQALGQPFEHALLTEYPCHAGVSEHSDSEKEVVLKSIIACLSLLGQRTLHILDANSREILLQLPLEPGSVYTMGGDFQQFLLHRIQAAPNQRASITWRHLQPPTDSAQVLVAAPSSSSKKPKRKNTESSRKGMKKKTYQLRNRSGRGKGPSNQK